MRASVRSSSSCWRSHHWSLGAAPAVADPDPDDPAYTTRVPGQHHRRLRPHPRRRADSSTTLRTCRRCCSRAPQTGVRQLLTQIADPDPAGAHGRQRRPRLERRQPAPRRLGAAPAAGRARSRSRTGTAPCCAAPSTAPLTRRPRPLHRTRAAAARTRAWCSRRGRCRAPRGCTSGWPRISPSAATSCSPTTCRARAPPRRCRTRTTAERAAVLQPVREAAGRRAVRLPGGARRSSCRTSWSAPAGRARLLHLDAATTRTRNPRAAGAKVTPYNPLLAAVRPLARSAYRRRPAGPPGSRSSATRSVPRRSRRCRAPTGGSRPWWRSTSSPARPRKALWTAAATGRLYRRWRSRRSTASRSTRGSSAAEARSSRPPSPEGS